MHLFKKTVAPFFFAVLMLSLAACGGNEEKSKGDTMSLEEIFSAILSGVDGLPETAFTELNEDNYHYYLFIDPVKGADALACDSLINAVPHSAVLLRLPEGTDASAIAEEIEKNADPRKWICVEAEKKIVKVHGNTILLVMSFSKTADSISENFDKLWE
ncbi:MAG: hypothetical protein GX488_01895 [Clostridiales bacterium]|nr:hypothetical protein [Clostridiales bacterium]